MALGLALGASAQASVLHGGGNSNLNQSATRDVVATAANCGQRVQSISVSNKGTIGFRTDRMHEDARIDFSPQSQMYLSLLQEARNQGKVFASVPGSLGSKIQWPLRLSSFLTH
jgi:hypothetical protein